ncbi:MAG: 50S ribosomal protein L24 [Berryella intestinalis]|uniref:50S ribosomal protein L24 n=1 Tax=Berryella intestinalis TaxID=1531429 RepID=UPI002A502017|nr:50S ribosomal protein L24 [Berryella intestinalis]MDD7369191.1 50S ribosomal protein L24 [Berryella intestinalis]MDY3128635.1 50S ribosomal protein L24 [Berryella intestinalis]
MKIKKGDLVKVIAGKDKGKEGVVLRALPERNRVVVEKVNIVKKAQRPTPQNQQGGIMSVEAPLHVSNVMLIDPATKKPTRIGYRIKEDGTKVRVAKVSGKDID